MKPPIPDDDDAFLEMTDVAVPTPEEREAADALRDALDWRSLENDDASLLASLKAAHAPTGIDEAEHRAIVDRVMATTKALPSTRQDARTGRGIVIRVAFGASALVAAAAAVVFMLRPPRGADTVEPFASRSTQSLFDEPFTMGGTTARVDRIASVRAAEFRENQFARWGVK